MDDLCYWPRSNNPKIAAKKLKNKKTKIENWANLWRKKGNPCKTQCTLSTSTCSRIFFWHSTTNKSPSIKKLGRKNEFLTGITQTCWLRHLFCVLMSIRAFWSRDLSRRSLTPCSGQSVAVGVIIWCCAFPLFTWDNCPPTTATALPASYPLLIVSMNLNCNAFSCLLFWSSYLITPTLTSVCTLSKRTLCKSDTLPWALTGFWEFFLLQAGSPACNNQLGCNMAADVCDGDSADIRMKWNAEDNGDTPEYQE